jgi:hypothetical protein
MTSAVARIEATSGAGLRTEGVLVASLEPALDMTPLILLGGAQRGSPRDVPVRTATLTELLSHGNRWPLAATAAINDPWRADLILMDHSAGVHIVESKARPPGFFALAEQVMQTASATVDQVARLSGATRRTYYNWRKHDRAPDDARRRLMRVTHWIERAIDEAPHLELREEVDPSREGSLGYLLAEGAADADLLERLSQLTISTEPIRVRVVERLHCADVVNEDELLDPGELAAMAAAAPQPLPRRRTRVAFEPTELTDSLPDDLG